MMSKKYANTFKMTAVAVASSALFSLGLSASLNAQPMRLPEPQQVKSAEDYKPDPTKRLTLEQFVKGAERLHGYLKNAVEKAEGEDKKFFAKEKAEIERQIKNPKAALAAQFKSIDKQIARLQKQNLFDPTLIAKMRMHYLETEAGKAVGVLINEKKKPNVSRELKAEIEYQLGIIAQRDQVNYKTALRHFSQAAQFAPGNIEYMTTLAELYTSLDKRPDAEKVYKEILSTLKNRQADKATLAKIKQKIAMLKK